MIITTQFKLADHEISKTLGIVMGNVTLSPKIGAQFSSMFRALVGGESAGLTKLLNEARTVVLNRIQEEAKNLGGDAIVGLQITSSTFEYYVEVMAYGTAVKLK